MSVHHKKGVVLSKAGGFTLLELLVVISIIAILYAIGLVTFGNVLKSSRDAKRQSDLKFIQSALEEYYADQIYYPIATSVVPGQPLIFSTGVNTKTYINQIPADPKSPTQDYSYKPTKADGTDCSSAPCTKYCLSAIMEGTNFPVGCAAAPYNYGVTRP